MLLAAQWSHEGDDERTGEQDGQNDGHQTEGLFPRASRHRRVRVEFAFFIVDLGIALLYFISRQDNNKKNTHKLNPSGKNSEFNYSSRVDKLINLKLVR